VQVVAEADRVVLLNNLKYLALAIRMFADDHNGSLPETLAEIKDYIRDEKLRSWAIENVEYLGKGVKLSAPMSPAASRQPMAYYRASSEKENETAVAFLDGHVEFISRPRLQELGIIQSR
jgi:hypothetical protein